MKLQAYLESIYMLSQGELQNKYTTYNHAKTQAAQSLISGHRWFNKQFAFVAILFNYLGVRLGVISPPKGVETIYAEMKAKMEAEATVVAKQAAQANPLTVVNGDKK